MGRQFTQRPRWGRKEGSLTQVALHLQYIQSGLAGRNCGGQRGTLPAGSRGCFRVSLVAAWAGLQELLGRDQVSASLPVPAPGRATPQPQVPGPFGIPVSSCILADGSCPRDEPLPEKLGAGGGHMHSRHQGTGVQWTPWWPLRSAGPALSPWPRGQHRRAKLAEWPMEGCWRRWFSGWPMGRALPQAGPCGWEGPAYGCAWMAGPRQGSRVPLGRRRSAAPRGFFLFPPWASLGPGTSLPHLWSPLE